LLLLLSANQIAVSLFAASEELLPKSISNSREKLMIENQLNVERGFDVVGNDLVKQHH